MKLSIDVNCDMGESFGAYKLGRDKEVIRYISSSNIACGFHASDPNVMERTVRLCKEYGVEAGAHPGYPDLVGFGRRYVEMDPNELINSVIYQVGALCGFLSLHQIQLQHVKMHGALYNYLVKEEGLFVKLIQSVKEAFGDVIFLTLFTKQAAALKNDLMKKGFRIALEAFPDRNYDDNGELLSRTHKDAVLHDADLIAKRGARMVMERGIESINGKWLRIEADTLCMHGDNEESIDAARRMKAHLDQDKIQIKPLKDLI